MVFLAQAVHLELEHADGQHGFRKGRLSLYLGLENGSLLRQPGQAYSQLPQADPVFFRPGVDLFQGLREGAEVQCQFGFFGGEEVLEKAKLHPRFSGRESNRHVVDVLLEPSVDVFLGHIVPPQAEWG